MLVKRYSTPLEVREMQVKTTMIYYDTSSRIAKIRKNNKSNIGKNIGS